MFHIFYLKEHKKFGIKKTLNLTKLLKFNNIGPFDPSPGPYGTGPVFLLLHTPFVSNSHTKFDAVSDKDLHYLLAEYL